MNQSLLKQATPDNVHIVVSLPKQRAYLMIGEQIVADGPISSGKTRARAHPRGHLHVLEKDPNHRSSILRRFCGRFGPRCTRRRQRPDRFGSERNAFRRCADEMVPASDRRRGRNARRNFARLSRIAWLHPESSDGAKLFYDYVKVGTPVDVGDYYIFGLSFRAKSRNLES